MESQGSSFLWTTARLEELEEESIRDNFVIIYELLDEVMDYGYPQILDADLLKEYIRTGKQLTSLSDIEKLK